MTTIITQLAKYLIIFFMVLYTVKCFTVLKPVPDDKKRKALNVQIFYVFMIHFLCFLTLYLKEPSMKIFGFYFLQTVVSIFYMVTYHSIYKKSSRLITNNMSFLLLIGYVMLTRLDYDKALKQFVFATTMLFVTAFIPLVITKVKSLKNWDMFYAIFGIIFLATVFVPGLGLTQNGSSNWISIGSFSLQPMEFVKIVFVFYVAAAFEKAEEYKDLWKIIIIAGLFMLVLVCEKDLGGAVIFLMIFIMMLYLATARHLIIIGGLLGGSAAAYFGYQLLGSKFSHVSTRINAWLDPFSYISGDGYQVCQSLFAIGSGGFDGRGLGNGLPSSIPVVTSDFIFAAICEELGVIFALCLILMYISCFIYFINISMKIRDTFYKNVAFGLTICFIFQIFLNVGGVIKFIPSTGVTLPLISYGVSSVVSTLVLFGIIQGICVLENGGEYHDRKEISKQNSEEQSPKRAKGANSSSKGSGQKAKRAKA